MTPYTTPNLSVFHMNDDVEQFLLSRGCIISEYDHHGYCMIVFPEPVELVFESNGDDSTFVLGGSTLYFSPEGQYPATLSL